MARQRNEILPELQAKAREKSNKWIMRATIIELIRYLLENGSPQKQVRRTRQKKGVLTTGVPVTEVLPTSQHRRKRRKMSATERKEVSERMKRYWASRRAGKGKKS